MANETGKTKRVYKYATGQDVPEGAIYLWSCKNGKMNAAGTYEYVWHYFLVEEKDF